MVNADIFRMTFRKSATRSHALDNQPAESIGHKRHAKPLHRSTYGQHRFLPTFAVFTGSIVALSGAMVLQSSVFAQVAPATIRAAGSFDQQGAPTKPPVRVEAIRALTTPQTTPQTISIPSSLARTSASTEGTRMPMLRETRSASGSRSGISSVIEQGRS